VKIYLADLTYTTLTLATEAFPLNVGYVAAFCKERFGDAVDIEIFKYLDDLDRALHEAPPDVLGVSNYPWNFNAGRAFFRLVRELSPRTIRVMGGPNIPLVQPEQTTFILENPIIDFYCHLEGEEAFSNLVQRMFDVGLERDRLKSAPVDGMLFQRDGAVVAGDMIPRRRNLDEIPSPYQTGLMDKFFDGKLSPLLETNRGCPFSCSFCHEGNQLLTKVNYFSTERVFADLDYIAERIPPETTNMMFADPNFAMYERDYEICEHLSRIQERTGWPKTVFASSGKNKKERIGRAIKLMNGALKLWMSVQSLDEQVLVNIRRQNIKTDKMLGLADTFEEMQIDTKSELILALPGETYASHIASITSLIDTGVDFISTYNLMLLNGTEFNTQVVREKYGFQTHFRVLPRDFGKLSNGDVAVEIEEIVTSTNAMSLDEYVELRKAHLILHVTYNDGIFSPLFKFLRNSGVSANKLFLHLVENVDEAPESVRDLISSFIKATRDEMWDTYESIHEFMVRDENYQRLCEGTLGANLLQTHRVRSMSIIGDWAAYLFQSATRCYDISEFAEAGDDLLEEVKAFCLMRIENLWGDDRTERNPRARFNYDIDRWLRDSKGEPLTGYRFDVPQEVEFGFTPEKHAEISHFVNRYGRTPSGIGRIVVNIGGMKKVFRTPLPA
jgi:radical SAM superfamily enzyme YgiQ (UPF0313 family)